MARGATSSLLMMMSGAGAGLLLYMPALAPENFRGPSTVRSRHCARWRPMCKPPFAGPDLPWERCCWEGRQGLLHE